MAKNKPQYKIGEKIFYKSLRGVTEATVKEIYIGTECFGYLVETQFDNFDPMIHLLPEKDIYKKLA